MYIESRIKQIRKGAGLTQSEFGEKIGVKGNTITTYETGSRIPSDAVIHSICREFNISELWLRTGEGEPHIERDEDEEFLEVKEIARRIYAHAQECIKYAKGLMRESKAQEPKSSNSFDDLKRLKELLDSGIITQEEFDAKKKQILEI